jgi:hypothetical protein
VRSVPAICTRTPYPLMTFALYRRFALAVLARINRTLASRGAPAGTPPSAGRPCGKPEPAECFHSLGVGGITDAGGGPAL